MPVSTFQYTTRGTRGSAEYPGTSTAGSSASYSTSSWVVNAANSRATQNATNEYIASTSTFSSLVDRGTSINGVSSTFYSQVGRNNGQDNLASRTTVVASSSTQTGYSFRSRWFSEGTLFESSERGFQGTGAGGASAYTSQTSGGVFSSSTAAPTGGSFFSSGSISSTVISATFANPFLVTETRTVTHVLNTTTSTASSILAIPVVRDWTYLGGKTQTVGQFTVLQTRSTTVSTDPFSLTHTETYLDVSTNPASSSSFILDATRPVSFHLITGGAWLVPLDTDHEGVVGLKDFTHTTSLSRVVSSSFFTVPAFVSATTGTVTTISSFFNISTFTVSDAIVTSSSSMRSQRTDGVATTVSKSFETLGEGTFSSYYIDSATHTVRQGAVSNSRPVWTLSNSLVSIASVLRGLNGLYTVSVDTTNAFATSYISSWWSSINGLVSGSTSGSTQTIFTAFSETNWRLSSSWFSREGTYSRVSQALVPQVYTGGQYYGGLSVRSEYAGRSTNVASGVALPGASSLGNFWTITVAGSGGSSVIGGGGDTSLLPRVLGPSGFKNLLVGRTPMTDGIFESGGQIIFSNGPFDTSGSSYLRTVLVAEGTGILATNTALDTQTVSMAVASSSPFYPVLVDASRVASLIHPSVPSMNPYLAVPSVFGGLHGDTDLGQMGIGGGYGDLSITTRGFTGAGSFTSDNSNGINQLTYGDASAIGIESHTKVGHLRKETINRSPISIPTLFVT